MIKVNLLNSVTERQGGAVAAVDQTVGSAASRLLLMSLAVGFLFLAVVGWDVISSQMAKSDADRRLAEQKQIAVELEAVMKEQKELETKIQNIDQRIAAIKKLREEQRGPSAVLEAVRERLAMTPGLYLKSIEQAGDQLVISGNSPDESVVTQFGRSLEFSNGLFSNLNIETQRAEVDNQLASATTGGEKPKVNVVNFTIKAAYTPSKAAGAATPGATTAAATTTPASATSPATPAQVAKN
ncbi:MAG: PilN domain-containing protein [Pyrinomonadaceae bacterium]|nr:PilN domain-containing protein [Pyrinomonadaceae bacterium]